MRYFARGCQRPRRRSDASAGRTARQQSNVPVLRFGQTGRGDVRISFSWPSILKVRAWKAARPCVSLGIHWAALMPESLTGTNPAAPTFLQVILWSGVVSWDRPFPQPVPLPRRRAARTLRDAGNYIRDLPESERDTPEWRLAVQMLIDAADDRGPMLFAKMGMERALNRKAADVINPDPTIASLESARRKLPSARRRH